MSAELIREGTFDLAGFAGELPNAPEHPYVTR